LFAAIDRGADTFDCVAPSRLARNGSVYAPTGRYNIGGAANRRSYQPLADDCDCYTCGHYTRAYLHHVYKAKEMICSTLLTIHNEHFIVGLVDSIRASIEGGHFDEFRRQFLCGYYGPSAAATLAETGFGIG
jgi:queuine tRNA-ribosyltransferase